MAIHYPPQQLPPFKVASAAKLKIAISAMIVSTSSLSAMSANAWFIGLNELPSQGTIRVSEPTGNNSKSLNIGVEFLHYNTLFNNEQTNYTYCDITGRVITESNTATENMDYSKPSNTEFSLRVTPIIDNSEELYAPSSNPEDNYYQDIPLDILADYEVEDDEEINVYISPIDIECGSDSGESTLVVEGSNYHHEYGSTIIIEDIFNEEPYEETDTSDFPLEQASLKTQVQDIADLGLHTGLIQSRRLGTELANIRKGKRGLNIDNLQVNIEGTTLPFSQWNSDRSYAEQDETDLVTYDSNQEPEISDEELANFDAEHYYQKDIKGAGAGDPIDDFGRLGVFVSGAIEIGEQHSNGANNNEYSSSLVLAGVDYHLSDNLVAGAALGYTSLESEVGDMIAKTDFNKFSYFGFASYYKENFYFDVIAGYGSTDYDLNRTVVADTLTALTDGEELNASIGTGYQFNVKRSALNFYGLLNYIDSGVNAYSEETDGLELTADVDDFNVQSLASNIGIELSFNINTSFAVISPQLTLGWEHQFEGSPTSITGNFVSETTSQAFEFETVKLDQNYYTGQVGITAAFTHGISSYLTYDTYADRDDLQSEMFSFGIRGQF